MKDEKWFPLGEILIAAAGWGLIGLFSRPLGSAGVSSLQMTFLRGAFVVVGLGLWMLLRDRKLFRIDWRDGWMFLGTGLVSIVFFNICYFTTIQLTTLSVASILLYTAPCFVMLMSAIFFRERVTAQKLGALVLAFGGCALVSGIGVQGITPKGLLIGLGAGFGYATYSIFGKLALRKYHSFTLIFYTFAVSTLCLLPFAGVPGLMRTLTQSPRAALASAGLGLVATVMPYILYTEGLERVEAGRASVLAFAEPMVATLAGIVAFGEALSLRSTLGIALIFTAIVLLNVPMRAKC